MDSGPTRSRRTETAWEARYLTDYAAFVGQILSWDPDYIVPVGRKSAKLLDSVQEILGETMHRIRYRDYFEYSSVELTDKRIAILDDSVCRTSGLASHRSFFENEAYVPRGNIRTYGFVGHRQLVDDPQLRCDSEATVYRFLSEAAYREYLVLQSHHCAVRATHPDIDHLVLKMTQLGFGSEPAVELWRHLSQSGYCYQLEPLDGLRRFGVQDPYFFAMDDVVSLLGPRVERDLVVKVRVSYSGEEQKLLIVPMVFPRLRASPTEPCAFASGLPYPVPFRLPCEVVAPHSTGKRCYLGLAFLLSALLARSLILSLRTENAQLCELLADLHIDATDLERYLGTENARLLADQTEEFIRAESTDWDPSLFRQGDAAPMPCPSTSPFSRENMVGSLRSLRAGYEQAIEANGGSPVDVRFEKPVEFFLETGAGMHPLMLTEMLDELCDIGMLVPNSTYSSDKECWRRVYRTGENPGDKFPWARTRYILAFAVRAFPGARVRRMPLEKALANFVADFQAERFPGLHCLETIQATWGPVNRAVEPVSKVAIPFSPEHLQGDDLVRWEDLFAFVHYDRTTQEYSASGSFRTPIDCFDSECSVVPSALRDYFAFLAKVHTNSGSVDDLNALALCRTKETYYQYLMWNVYEWTRAFSRFLDQLQFGQVSDSHIAWAGKLLDGALGKIRLAGDFSTSLFAYGKIRDEDEIADDIWRRYIAENLRTEDVPLRHHGNIRQASAVVEEELIPLYDLARMLLGMVEGAPKQRIQSRLCERYLAVFHRSGTDIQDLLRQGVIGPREAHSILGPMYRGVTTRIGLLPTPSLSRYEATVAADDERYASYVRQRGVAQAEFDMARGMVADGLQGGTVRPVSCKIYPDGTLIIDLMGPDGARYRYVRTPGGALEISLLTQW